ncbi:TetR/AcrR family transcriptional regulator [Sphingobium lactosutens]|uniref:TetR/AcrR family transcriptional regulator n=1 Tax=Sphingobium lactosutens TaxID=522773 RepID=UPI0015C0D817|nr:TetR family transcriptional regulator [Sphingobium lactosutens]
MSISSVNTAPTRRGRGRPKAGADGARVPVPELLLSAAIEQFATHGYDAVGVRQIASHVGVDAAMIVHHFGSKLLLWQAAIDHLSLQMLAALESQPVDATIGSNVGERLDQAVGQIVDMLCDTPALSAFILREVVLENDRSDYSYERLVKPIHDRLRPLIVGYAGPQGGVDADYLFVALTGAVVSTVAARRLFDRMSGEPQDDREFRNLLKNTVSAQLAVRVGRISGFA